MSVHPDLAAVHPEVAIDDVDDGLIGRRSMLRNAGIAAGVAALAKVVATAPTDAAESISGSWMIDRQDESTPSPIRGVFSFAGGGVVTYIDIAPANGGAPAMGTWASSDDGSFRATFWAGGDADPATNTPSFTAEARAVINVDADTMSGTYVNSIFDPATDATLAVLNGTFTGSRIVA